ncbi:MAG: T9SS type A sorting domain-containing protein [Nonlabens sp.]
MKQIYLWMLLFVSATSFAQQPIITTIVDGDCSGGTPKLLEIYADGIVDFSSYALRNQTNANSGTFGNTTNIGSLFPMGTSTVVQDDFIYIATDNAYDPQAPDANSVYVEFPSLINNSNVFESGVVNLNGDDRIQIILDDGSETVVDQLGVSDLDGTGESWEYDDSYAQRIDGSGPDGGFIEANWNFAGVNAIDNLGRCKNAGNDTYETILGGIGIYTTTASTTPEISATGPVTGLEYFENNGPSQEGSFTISGRNLTADIVLTVPSADFEISETSGGQFGQSITLSQNNGQVASTTIFVRMAAGLLEGSYTEDISAVSGGAPTQTITVAGDVEDDDPTIFISGGASGMNYNQNNGPSPEDSFAVSGRFLTDNSITVSVDAPFEMSLASNGTFSTSVNVPVTNGSAEFEDVFIRLAAGQSIGQYTGTVNISSTGATSDTIQVDGEVLPTANCPSIGDLIITEIMQNPSINNDPAGEYIEVYNNSSNPIDLVSFVIADDVSANETHTINSSVVVPAGGYVVLGNDANRTNTGDATLDYAYDSISLGNGTDGVAISCGGVILDQVIWDNGSTFPDPSGASMELAQSVINGANAVTANDDGTNWGTATNDFGGGDFGTPGAMNNFTLSNESIDAVSFNIYPNPVEGTIISIETSNGEALNVKIFSTLGQQVLVAKNVTRDLNIASLDAGIYLVKLTQGENSQTRKLIVK